ncbi:uncharacterized protein BT62DRAFT_1013344 [Guyanagaster necrorhizus]|uniref:Uncharacterized protein n=1 Tax=Guyanagaster necrorhizus TaxID=856835 RepID=A0A9P8AL61_9AGAR|nr:uncharacterized protein BT62DRAFT_1013344 [Guyanagaster necrorhizus MCA 3950]KAG7439893.1 hypothetical protein BT62DRAFT_1013344 [Guyanagaster necrorhizus MCA 3950]
MSSTADSIEPSSSSPPALVQPTYTQEQVMQMLGTLLSHTTTQQPIQPAPNPQPTAPAFIAAPVTEHKSLFAAFPCLEPDTLLLMVDPLDINVLIILRVLLGVMCVRERLENGGIKVDEGPRSCRGDVAATHAMSNVETTSRGDALREYLTSHRSSRKIPRGEQLPPIRSMKLFKYLAIFPEEPLLVQPAFGFGYHPVTIGQYLQRSPNFRVVRKFGHAAAATLWPCEELDLRHILPPSRY